MNLTIIGGLQASGKTTLMRMIRDNLGEPTKNKHGTLHYEEYDNHIVYGIYNGETFDGTDKLSMAVITDAIGHLKRNKKDILIEGDRLFNLKFLDSAKSLGYDIRIIICTVSDKSVLLNRFKKRGQIQKESFIKGRMTKINNVTAKYGSSVIDTKSGIDQSNILKFIR
jgi:dephospho-CoA kinase